MKLKVKLMAMWLFTLFFWELWLLILKFRIEYDVFDNF